MLAFVTYYRVSTARQGQGGLGLDAQRSAVVGFIAGSDLLAEFTEIESGRKNDRPQLSAALNLCRRKRAVLVIAKLDRLARNVAFVARLMESGAEFVAVDNPHVNKLMIHMLAAFAEHERDQISARTVAALAVAKARGVRLDNPNGAGAAAHARSVLAASSAPAPAQALPRVKALRDGCATLRVFARRARRRRLPSAAWRLLLASKALTSDNKTMSS